MAELSVLPRRPFDLVIDDEPVRVLPAAHEMQSDCGQSSGQFFLNRHVIAGKGQPRAAEP